MSTEDGPFEVTTEIVTDDVGITFLPGREPPTRDELYQFALRTPHDEQQLISLLAEAQALYNDGGPRSARRINHLLNAVQMQLLAKKHKKQRDEDYRRGGTKHSEARQ